MSHFRSRYRAREWTSKDLDKLFTRFFWPFMAGSFLFLFLIDNEVERRADAGYYAGSAVLAILYTAVSFWLLGHARPKEQAGDGRAKRILLSLGLGVLFAAMGGGYSFMLNAVTGSFQPIVIAGPVVHLEQTSGGFSGIGRHVTVLVDGRKVTFSETGEKYAQLRIGDVYRTTVRLGGFGYYWRPGRNYWK